MDMDRGYKGIYQILITASLIYHFNLNFVRHKQLYIHFGISVILYTNVLHFIRRWVWVNGGGATQTGEWPVNRIMRPEACDSFSVSEASSIFKLQNCFGATTI